jgi:hypothetical protein
VLLRAMLAAAAAGPGGAMHMQLGGGELIDVRALVDGVAAAVGGPRPVETFAVLALLNGCDFTDTLPRTTIDKLLTVRAATGLFPSAGAPDAAQQLRMLVACALSKVPGAGAPAWLDHFEGGMVSGGAGATAWTRPAGEYVRDVVCRAAWTVRYFINGGAACVATAASTAEPTVWGYLLTDGGAVHAPAAAYPESLLDE